MKIYVAYRYSNPSNVIDILGNIGTALEAGVKIALKGHIPYIPHADCLIGIWSKGKLPKEYYYKLGMEWLKCCDAFLLLDKKDLDIKNSGVIREYKYAKSKNMKIFYSLDEIPDLKLK